jgi:hypothetical protein
MAEGLTFKPEPVPVGRHLPYFKQGDDLNYEIR